MDVMIASVADQRKELPPDQGIAPGPMLEFDQTVHSLAGILIVRVEEGGAVVPLDHCDSPAILQERPELFKRLKRSCEMFKNETNKNVVKAPRFKRESEDISLPERHIGDTFHPDLFFGPSEGILRYVN
jgi:hypothetical protein